MEVIRIRPGTWPGSWRGEPQTAHSVPGGAPGWSLWPIGIVRLTLPILLAIALWWHLPRHVARVYGMER